jgi:hypothetical protein
LSPIVLEYRCWKISLIYGIANCLWNPGRESSSKMHYILVTHEIGPNLLPPPNYCLEISQNSVIQSTHCKCLLCTSTYCKLVQMCSQAMFYHIQGIDLRNPAITVQANVELFYFLLEHPHQLLSLCLLQYLHIQDTVINFCPPQSSLFTHSSEKTSCFSELGRKNMKGT